MPLERLELHNFRNIEKASLNLHPRLNIFIGENGSGKTAILESLSVLAHGRSFRSHKSKPLVRFGETKAVAYASGSNLAVGVEKVQNGKSQHKINQEEVKSASCLADRLPLQIINESTFQLVDGPAKIRRRLFDWLMFHVKHEFRDVWKRYNYCLKQRNALLRRDKIAWKEVDPWTVQLAELGEEVNRLRLSCFPDFIEQIQQSCSDRFSEPFDVSFISGWPDGSLYQTLEANFARDIKLRYTAVGPHRSEFVMRSHERHLAEVFSRGQQKTLCGQVVVSELELFYRLTQKLSFLLIDDLLSELDKNNVARLSKKVHALNAQVFFTAIDVNDVLTQWLPHGWEDCKMFHVKHGEINEFNP